MYQVVKVGIVFLIVVWVGIFICLGPQASVLDAPMYKYQLDPYGTWAERGLAGSNNNCGPAVNAMVIEHFLGINLSTAIDSSPLEAQAMNCLTEARWMYCEANGLPGGYRNTFADTTGADRMIAVLQHVGLQAELVEGEEVTLQRIEQAIDRGSLVICHVDVEQYYPHDPSLDQLRRARSHYVLAYGHTVENFVIHDPGYSALHHYNVPKVLFKNALEKAYYGNNEQLIIVSKAVSAPTPFTFSSHAYTGTGGEQGGVDTNWHFTLAKKTSEIIWGETAYGLVRVESITARHRWIAEVRQDGSLVKTIVWNWNEVGEYGWDHSYFWPSHRPTAAGPWQFKVFLETGPDEAIQRHHIVDLPFTVINGSVSFQPFVYDGNAHAGYGPVSGGAETNWLYSLAEKRSVFATGDTVCALLRIDDVQVNHSFRFIATVRYPDGREEQYTEYESAVNDLRGGIWDYAHTWAHVYDVVPGQWKVYFYIGVAGGYKLLDTVEFTVAEPSGETDNQPAFSYDGNGHTGRNLVWGTAENNWTFSLAEQASAFTVGDNVVGLIYLLDVRHDIRFRTETYRNGVMQYDHVGDWLDVGSGWDRAYHWPTWNNIAEGNWEFRMSVDDGTGWHHVDTLAFSVANQPQSEPSPPQASALRFDFNNHAQDGWRPGFDTWLPPQDQPDQHTWKVIADGPNPGVVSPVLPDGYTAQNMPQLSFSVKVRGAVRQTECQVYVMDMNGYWQHAATTPSVVDYQYHEYTIDWSWLGATPIKQFSIELTQNPGYEEWIFDWIALE